VRAELAGDTDPCGVGTRVSGFVHGGLPRLTCWGLVVAPVAAPAPPPTRAPTAMPGGPASAPTAAPVAAPAAAPPVVRSFGDWPHAESRHSAPRAAKVNLVFMILVPLLRLRRMERERSEAVATSRCQTRHCYLAIEFRRPIRPPPCGSSPASRRPKPPSHPARHCACRAAPRCSAPAGPRVQCSVRR
jgi:hypothetical protein